MAWWIMKNRNYRFIPYIINSVVHQRYKIYCRFLRNLEIFFHFLIQGIFSINLYLTFIAAATITNNYFNVMRKILIFICSLAIAQTGYTQLSKPEKKAIDYINTHINDAIQLLTETVNINSGSLNIEGVKKVGEIYTREFKKLGFTVEWVSMTDSMHRAGHLVSTHVGKKGKRLFLIGHLDTVFEPDMPAGPYTILNDSTATGQGVNDMKGGDVVVITALQALQSAGLLKDMNIIAYFTGDEEKSGSHHTISRGDFIARAKTCDIALGFESAIGLHTVAAARRGASGWVLNVTAKTGHSSTVFGDSAGYGAIYEAARVINTFREQLSNEKYLTFNPGLIIGGSEVKLDKQDARGETVVKTNIISPSAKVVGDLRFLTEEQKDAARGKMKAIVANHLIGTNSTISFSRWTSIDGTYNRKSSFGKPT